MIVIIKCELTICIKNIVFIQLDTVGLSLFERAINQ